ncbi:MAG TPA: nitrophenyl compound nitroreductase subunit ArsF family protein [Draconibacterium sp.]|nr:nitrophenyl compound nitroreductase subunit ArsF family protein [Draconibacterium sp.]
MKKSLFLCILFTALFSGFLVNAQTGSKAKIQAYYFHNQVRCETCKTVESEAKLDLKELYGDKVSFQALNLEDKATQEIAKKLKVSGQTLLVVNGSKQVNLTNEGFLYAVTNPVKFKSIIKEKVDPLVKQ